MSSNLVPTGIGEQCFRSPEVRIVRITRARQQGIKRFHGVGFRLFHFPTFDHITDRTVEIVELERQFIDAEIGTDALLEQGL